jgi:hypothetical protein
MSRLALVVLALTTACGSRSALDDGSMSGLIGAGDAGLIDAGDAGDGTAQCQPLANLGTDCQAWSGGSTACADDAFGIQCGGRPGTQLTPSPFLDCKLVATVAPRVARWCCFCVVPTPCGGCVDVSPIR